MLFRSCLRRHTPTALQLASTTCASRDHLQGPPALFLLPSAPTGCPSTRRGCSLHTDLPRQPRGPPRPPPLPRVPLAHRRPLRGSPRQIPQSPRDARPLRQVSSTTPDSRHPPWAPPTHLCLGATRCITPTPADRAGSSSTFFGTHALSMASLGLGGMRATARHQFSTVQPPILPAPPPYSVHQAQVHQTQSVSHLQPPALSSSVQLSPADQ